MSDEYETVWDGARDRLGACKSLTSYTGPSTLTALTATPGFKHGEIERIYEAFGVRGGKRHRPASSATLLRARQANARKRDA